MGYESTHPVSATAKRLYPGAGVAVGWEVIVRRRHDLRSLEEPPKRFYLPNPTIFRGVRVHPSRLCYREAVVSGAGVAVGREVIV